ncbi:MAG: hypothetical protein R2760_06000 [Chitinophagales bacterium]
MEFLTAIGIGGDPIIGTTMKDAVEHLLTIMKLMQLSLLVKLVELWKLIAVIG